MHTQRALTRDRVALLMAIFMTCSCGWRREGPRAGQASMRESCGVRPGQVVEYEQAICIAKSSGMGGGLCGLTIKNSYPDQLKGRLVWAVRSSLQGPVLQGPFGCMCGTSGEVWYVAFEDGQIVGRSTWTGGCLS